MAEPELIHSIPVDYWSMRTRVFLALCGASVHRDHANRQLHLAVTCPRCLAIEDEDGRSLASLVGDL